MKKMDPFAASKETEARSFLELSMEVPEIL